MDDALLLERFVMHKDEDAFEAIVTFHGPLVLGICRRMLDDPSDVEDAFQATFMILVRKASSLRDRDRLANWLFGVAHRVATRARVDNHRRRVRERSGPRHEAVAIEPRHDPEEFRAVFDDELARLSNRLRTAVILCELEGLSQDEAAWRLGCPVGTIKSRLHRARARLRSQLLRRGVTPAALAAGPLIESAAANAAIPGIGTIRAAISLAAGAVASASTTALVEGVARSMIMTRAMTMAAGLVALATAVAGTMATSSGMARDDPPPRVGASVPIPDRAMVRNVLREWWSHLETLELRDVSCEVDDAGRPALSGRRSVVEISLGRGDRRAVVHGSLGSDDRVRVAQEKRDDGRTQFYLMSTAKGPGRITDATIKPQVNTRDAYHDEMGTILWLVTPHTTDRVARPLYQHLDFPEPATKFEVGRDADGRPTVVLTLAYGKQRYELDPDHDFLPRRVSGDLHEITVTRFARADGRWFPVEGLATSGDRQSRPRNGAFVVTNLRINRPIPDSRFGMPDGLDGMRILDLTGGTWRTRPVEE